MQELNSFMRNNFRCPGHIVASEYLIPNEENMVNVTARQFVF